MQELYAVTSIDGRYHKDTSLLSPFFSEYALMRYRLYVEISYLLSLAQEGIVPSFTAAQKNQLLRLASNFSLREAQAVKGYEAKLKHDVKALEYFMRARFKALKLKQWIPYIHIGLTSEDVNSLAYALSFNDFNRTVLTKTLAQFIKELEKLALRYQDTPLMGRTHAQAAVPTTFGKQCVIYCSRLEKHYSVLKKFVFEAKLTGAVGDLNALAAVYPQVNWPAFSRRFIKKLKLAPNMYTTQILPYDNWLEYFNIVGLVMGIVADFCRNIWLYTALGEVGIAARKLEVGSSTMPHKVNPINFENAEGNAELALMYCQFYGRKLVFSRLQRDLSDSTVRRTFGSAFSHALLALTSAQRGLQKIYINSAVVKANLDEHWETLMEAVQVFLRQEGDGSAYKKTSILSQGKKFNKNMYKKVIQNLKLDKKTSIFSNLSPDNYIGYSRTLTRAYIKKQKKKNL